HHRPIPPPANAQLPRSHLHTTHELGPQYADGKLGFSVQFPLFVEAGNKPGRLLASDAYDNFGTKVGWRKDEQWIQFKQNLDYSLEAPLGHLPNPRSEYEITGGRLNYTALTQRMVECNIVSYPQSNPPVYRP
ncbi:MAG: GUN4 domain-containing protein, partial [Cyanobacteria bacterium P01_G01_bin.49]